MHPTSLELREYPASPSAQICISHGVFNADYRTCLQAYFWYFYRQCRQVTSIAMMDGTAFPLQNNTDLVDIIMDIRSQVSHEDIMSKLAGKCNMSVPVQRLQNAVDLALRLLIMMDVGVFDNAYTGRGDVTWTTGTLADFLKRICLFDARPVVPCLGVKLESSFHVYNIEHIAGLKVQLTTNLYDHLLLREDIRTVFVFHYAAFLKSHKSSSVFPGDFIEETLKTLALLFPKGNRQVNKWYKRKERVKELDFAVLTVSHPWRRIDEYKYWRDRLVTLKEAFDDSQPRSIGQWWHDRRDATQWYAVWIAVFFTVFFGLVQSVVSILQLYKAYYPTPA